MNTQQFPLSHQAGITLVRISLGVMWIAHALLKLLVFTLPGTAQYFQSIGLPGWLAYWIFAFELIGGLALVMGIYARQVAILLLPIMVAATVVHIPNGWVHTSAGGGWEYPLFLSIMSVALWLAGDGAFALKSSTRFSLQAISEASESTSASNATNTTGRTS
jgi:putative oxidoreductase